MTVFASRGHSYELSLGRGATNVSMVRKGRILAVLAGVLAGFAACGGIASVAERRSRSNDGGNSTHLMPSAGNAGEAGQGGGNARSTSKDEQGGAAGRSATVSAVHLGTGGKAEVGSTNVPQVCEGSPWVLKGSVPNARSLGGVTLAAGATVRCGMLFRGSYLSNVSEVSCTEFAALGIRSVLDLRSLGEQSNLPAQCVTDQARIISAPLPIPYNVSPDDYLADLYTDASIRTAFTVLSDEHAYPVYFHCYYGKDRTGVLAAVILLGLGASRETVQAEYALTGEAGLSYYPASINAVLDEIDRIGGINAYFDKMGVLPNQVEAMRKILTAPK